MKLGRRSFLALTGMAAVGAALPSVPLPVVSGWASVGPTLLKGDIITIAGMFVVNPITGLETGQLQQFVVTADGTADSVSLVPANWRTRKRTA